MWLRKSIFWLAVCALLAFVLLAYPLYVIRPFRYQGARELSAALALVRFRPVLNILLVAVSLILSVLAWRRSPRNRVRVAASVCAFLVCAFAFLGEVNLYELMFHPMNRPSFSPASKSKLHSDEEVIAVRIQGQARAYPVRSISYHHIVNDTLAGLPIVATY